MLNVVQQKSAEGAKAYFSKSDYLSEGQELVDHWGGSGAERLGLTGEVQKQDFDALCDNLDPRTGEPLTALTRDGRRVGYDFIIAIITGRLARGLQRRGIPRPEVDSGLDRFEVVTAGYYPAEQPTAIGDRTDDAAKPMAAYAYRYGPCARYGDACRTRSHGEGAAERSSAGPGDVIYAARGRCHG